MKPQPPKKCQYCGASDNLYTDRSKRIYSLCVNCRPHHLRNKSDKSKTTFIQKYGVSNPSQLQSVKDKKVETTRKHFGVDYPSQSKRVRGKIEDKNLKQRGVRNVSQDSVVKEKKKRNSIKKYGVECTLQAEGVQEKIKDTLLDKYGVDHPLRSDEIKDKVRATNLGRYGVASPAQNAEIMEKTKRTNLERYGVEYPVLDPTVQNKIRMSFKQNYWEIYVLKLEKKKIKPLFDKDFYLENETGFTFQCFNCKTSFVSDETNPQRVRCTCTHYRSQQEDEILSWLEPIAKVEPNKRFFESGKYEFEVDIWLEEFNLGIDFHGLYWHSDLFKDRSYHQRKSQFFSQKGIVLVQIFENEWKYKQDIVKSIILNKLGCVGSKIYARQCKIREISNTEAKLFLIANHLQANCPSSVRIGLYYKEELVSLATFGKSRYRSDTEYELLRFVNKTNTSITGGFGRIVAYFCKNYSTSLISYVDLRYFDGRIYLKNGFECIGTSKPNYFYFKSNDLELLSRIQFQKHKLKDKLSIFDPQLSEYENMLQNGYLRIFDAGNLKLVYNKN